MIFFKKKENQETTAKTTAKVEWRSLGKTIHVSKGTSLLDAALDNEIPLEHACGGCCACTTCQIEIVEGEQHLSAMSEDERDRLESKAKLTPRKRLGCQTKVLGDIVIDIPSSN